MTDAIRGIDHAIVGVGDLAAARAAFERLGFTAAPLGNHVGKATANHCIMFADSYLELLGINEPEHSDTLGLGTFLDTRGEGLVKIALGTPDADAARATIGARGFALTGPDDLARPVDDPPGAIARFRNVQIPAAQTGGLSTFLCGHLTPELMRPPGTMDHPNGARNLAAATAVVDDVEAVAGPWARLLDRPAEAPGYGNAILDTGRGQVLMGTPKNIRMDPRNAGLLRVTPLPDPLPARPFYYSLRIEVSSVTSVLRVLLQNGVGPHATSIGMGSRPSRLLVEACGVPLEFAEA